MNVFQCLRNRNKHLWAIVVPYGSSGFNPHLGSIRSCEKEAGKLEGACHFALLVFGSVSASDAHSPKYIVGLRILMRDWQI